jgi:hypothetical protein
MFSNRTVPAHSINPRLTHLLRPAVASGALLLAGPYTAAVGGVFPASFDLDSLLRTNGGDGTEGFVLLGVAKDDLAGRSVSSAGDMNGDGIGDLIVGAVAVGSESGGHSYIVFGRQDGFGAEFELSSLLAENGGDGRFGMAIHGAAPGDVTGYSVAGAGDVNGDDLDDVLVGAPGAYSVRFGAGRAFILFGRADRFPPEFELESLLPANGGDGRFGVVLDGASGDENAGEAVAGVGDLNKDGADDMIVASARAKVGSEPLVGRAYVVLGNAQGFPPQIGLRSLFPAQGGDGSAGFVINGVDPFSHTGHTVGGGGDVNGDGVADVIIAGYGANPGGLTGAGQTYVVFGRRDGFAPVFELQSLLEAGGGDGTVGFTIDGVNAGDHSGAAARALGDFNADGIDDLIIGAINAKGSDVNSGSAYVVFGHAHDFPAQFQLATLLPANGGDGSTGFALKGIDRSDLCGISVSGAGDINGDGVEDMSVGARAADPGERDDAGESYVVFGRTNGFPSVVELSSLLPDQGGDGTTGFVINGIDTEDGAGLSVASAGDVNGDGVGDVLVGTFTADVGDTTHAGQAYVIFGRADEDGDGIADRTDNCQTLPNADQRDTNADGFGNLCDPDLNDDGIVNFLDLATFKSVFLTGDADADFNGDGNVNFPDLAILKSFFFDAPGPSGQVPSD